MIAYQLKIAGEWGDPIAAPDETAAEALCVSARENPAVEATAILRRKSVEKPWTVIYNARRQFKWKA